MCFFICFMQTTPEIMLKGSELVSFSVEIDIIGIFHDIDSQGNAIIMTKNGTKTYNNSGEIKIDGIY